jgi:hypothetical protein
VTCNCPRLLATNLIVCLLSIASRSFAQQAPVASVTPVVVASDAAYFTTNEPAAAAKIGKTLHAYRVRTTPPKIDGTLDDEVWRSAPSGGDFVQWDPDNDEPASERTLMQVAYDDHYVYAAIHCFDRNAEGIARGLGRRDDNPPTDFVSLAFDPRHDHLTGYVFQANASGVQSDFYFYDDDRSDRDFDAVWEVRTTIAADGWIAEFRIPFSQMRFRASPNRGQVWGFSVKRFIRRRSETEEWTAKPRGERGEVSRWGHLVFEDPVAPPRRIEVQPYSVARSERQAPAESEYDGSVGVDVRLGLGTAATLAASINPDFGQVEQDPAVLNLSVYETFFPEKRPFFLEDSRTFVPPYTLFQLFHSRRIGRVPGRYAIPDGETAESRATQTTVLAASKFTGKGSGWTYGATSAVTAREYAHLSSGADMLIEPLTSYNAVRIQRDVRNGTSNIGGIVTGVVREGDRGAYTGGFDYNLRWDRNRVSWNGQWAATRAASTTDGLATSGGGVTNFAFTRKHYAFNGHFDHIGRDFRVNDLGFLRTRVNRTETDGSVVLEQPDPWKTFRHLLVQPYFGRAWNDDKLVFNQYAGAYAFLQFLNYWSIDFEAGRNFQVFDDLDTRGGPPILVPARRFVSAILGTDTRKSWRLLLSANTSRNAAGGWDARIGPGLTLQPSGRLIASISGNYTVARDSAQWITNTDVDGDGATDNVYGTLARHVVDLTLRSTLSIHRDMSLQLFLQPFVAVGDYENIRKLARPMSFDFVPATLTYDPDFNSKSMRGNVVLRWEYVRGSTLYFVWNTSMSDSSRPGVFSPFRDVGDAFRGSGPSVFMVKISYRLAR